MLIYGLNAATHGSYGEGETIPVMPGLMLLTIPLYHLCNKTSLPVLAALNMSRIS
jgi:hypothetical protein